jgi:hypothetical protein
LSTPQKRIYPVIKQQRQQQYYHQQQNNMMMNDPLLDTKIEVNNDDVDSVMM